MDGEGRHNAHHTCVHVSASRGDAIHHQKKKRSIVAMSSAAAGRLCGLSGNSFEINFELIYISDLKFSFLLRNRFSGLRGYGASAVTSLFVDP